MPVSCASSRTALTSASSSTARPASTSCSIEVLKAPSFIVMACRSSGCWSIGMPMAAPMALASSITLDTKLRTRGSPKIRSVVAPVKALMGLTVMLPQSLYQTSLWIWTDTLAAKPARCSRATSACTRSLVWPDGEPMIKPLPKWWRTWPGPLSEQLECTTPPTTWAAGIARAISPVGSTACSRWPAWAPPKPSRNHHGTPFIAVSTTVSGPISGPIWRATASSEGALTAITTRSCTPSAAGSALARTATLRVTSPCCTRSPCCCSASSVAPRATTLTWVAASFSAGGAAASPTPSQPPMAPAPNMQTRGNAVDVMAGSLPLQWRSGGEIS